MSESEPAPVGKIFAKMASILAEFPVVTKDRQNAGQGYKFRGIDDVYVAAQPLLAKHKVFPLPTYMELKFTEVGKTAKGASQYRAEVSGMLRFTAVDGSFVDVSIVGEGFDTADKAGMKAISNAVKYGYWNTFCVPSDVPKDSEAFDDEATNASDVVEDFEPRSKR